MLVTLEICTVLLGTITTSLSAILANRFWRLHHDLSNALALMLFAEFVAGTVTVIFAMLQLKASVMGGDYLVWPFVNPETATALRWVLFLSMGATSIHLFKRLEALSK